MHQDLDLNIDEISKTEGHMGIDIKVRKSQVEYARLKVKENKRFFTQGVIGKNFESLSQFLSRICGTCSISHSLCSLEAVEKAIGVNISDQVLTLRKLMMNGLMIRDHGMHLYLFCLPDILGKDSALDFEKSDRKFLNQAFDVKAAGNNLSKIIGGRAVHPTTLRIGGFRKLPTGTEIKNSIKELESIREYVVDLVDIFYKSTFSFDSKTQYVALFTDDFSFLEGKIKTSEGLEIPESDYWDFLSRVVIPYSQATGFKFEGKEYMVGALARMNLNKDNIHKDTKKSVSKALKVFPSDDVFKNSLAQAIEILHCIDSSIETLDALDCKQESESKFIVDKSCKGIGVVEAPRGTLYHMIDFDRAGKVKYGNFIIPTAQNQIQMEKDIEKLVSGILDKGKKEIQLEIEKLIRAYDPCFSCASHFLKLKWI
jgi:coenzyme F420-reducing hydrogenase alpha subunit